jgi:putative CocE/NonD family hydrolase
VISVCASDDRYADDAHYMGGCLLNENLTWGTVLLTFSTLPPDPAVVGDGWRATWLARIDGAALFPETWLRHQRRDEYWRRGSVREDLGAIACPVYVVGGWADAYTNAIPRLLAGLAVPRKGVVGPWGHVYPHRGVPGPAIGFLQEALRWWDRWLKGVETGVLDGPRYRVWMGDRWVAEDGWPSARIAPRRWALAPGRLADDGGRDVALETRSRQSVGQAAGEWCAFGEEETPGAQDDDDAGSLVFDSTPLGAALEILGDPVVVLEVAADRPEALVAVRLNELGRTARRCA